MILEILGACTVSLVLMATIALLIWGRRRRRDWAIAVGIVFSVLFFLHFIGWIIAEPVASVCGLALALAIAGIGYVTFLVKKGKLRLPIKKPRMSIVKKVILAVVAAIVLVLGAGGILYALGLLRPPELEDIRLSWGQITEQSIRVDAAIDVNNRLPFGLGSGSIRVEVPIHFHNVKTVQLYLSKLSMPRGHSTLEASAIFFQATLPQWWPSFVNRGEVLVLRIKPQVNARLLGFSLSRGLPTIRAEAPIPIMSNMRSDLPITMGFDDAPLYEILRNPVDHFTSSPPQPATPVLTICSWELHWGEVSSSSTQILGTVVVRNELTVPLPIQGLRLGLDMNEIEVIPEINITPDQPQLPPGEEIPIALEAHVDNNNLVQWWTSHLQHHEETRVTVRLGITIILPITSEFGLVLTDAFPLPLLPVPGWECTIQTDIMGMANYQIAKMLGKPSGREPEVVTVEWTRPKPEIDVEQLPTPPLLLPRVLRVFVEPTGSGTVSPPGGEIPAEGAEVLITPPGGEFATEVVITAIPNPGYDFDYWSGDASGTSRVITIIMDDDKSVTAHFKLIW